MPLWAVMAKKPPAVVLDGQTQLALGLDLPPAQAVTPQVATPTKKPLKRALSPKAKRLPYPMPLNPEQTNDTGNDHVVWSVSQLTHYLSQTLEEDPVLGLPVVVRGEVSNVSRSPRGHIYFSVKDDKASVSATLWASAAQRLPFDLKNGLDVFVTGSLEVYAPRGTYALIVKQMEPVGVGALQLAFQQLKAKLEAEGLFLPERKRPLPYFPQRIGIITSRTGAVIHDMLRVLRRKNPLVSVLLHPVAVQGDGAAKTIAQALSTLNQPQYQLDLLIVARGGGSFEDLFCFSEEAVVRAIVASRLPVLTGLGHEPDFSLADAAADRSASTPTAAAELAVPDYEQLTDWLQACRQQVGDRLKQVLRQAEQGLDQQTERLLEGHQRRLVHLNDKLAQQQERLVGAMALQWQRCYDKLQSHSAQLQAVSPLATLQRGYSVASTAQGKVLTSVQGLSPGDSFLLRLADGQLKAQVLHTGDLPLH
jgi:exodeoxyribonuclease VII large subunit